LENRNSKIEIGKSGVRNEEHLSCEDLAKER
jgi:hypothetical protein